MQGAPAVELHASMAGILATYDDGGSQMVDAADTHLALNVGPLSIDLHVSSGSGLSVQVFSAPDAICT